MSSSCEERDGTTLINRGVVHIRKRTWVGTEATISTFISCEIRRPSSSGSATARAAYLPGQGVSLTRGMLSQRQLRYVVSDLVRDVDHLTIVQLAEEQKITSGVQAKSLADIIENRTNIRIPEKTINRVKHELANEHDVILSWGFALSESTETWTWFLAHLKDAFPSADRAGNIIISDRQKVREASFRR